MRFCQTIRPRMSLWRVLNALVAGLNAATATLLIDGVECLNGYAGHSDYVEDRGFQLGVSSYLSANGGEAWVRRARFEPA